jgi:hypothetical protein
MEPGPKASYCALKSRCCMQIFQESGLESLTQMASLSLTGCDGCKERRVHVCIRFPTRVFLTDLEIARCDESFPCCLNVTKVGFRCGVMEASKAKFGVDL